VASIPAGGGACIGMIPIWFATATDYSSIAGDFVVRARWQICLQLC
jgi:hypothetical protein